MILITGASGQLGQAVAQTAEKRNIPFVCTDADTLDITDSAETEKVICSLCPEAVINCAAFTDVNGAESKKELCEKINVAGAKNLAVACEKAGARLVHISTDYVFNGRKNGTYEPEDETDPLSVYGKTKRDSEIAVRESCKKHFIVRISWLFGGDKGNFILTMLRLSKEKDEIRVVNDQTGSPTYTYDLAPLLLDMAQSEKYGTYHATNEGFCTWYELAKEAVAYTDSTVRFIPVTSEEYPTPAVRPKNSRLSKDCLTENGFNRLPPWQDAVKRYMEKINK
ncbi:MAG: dTDP-4-dehydrorhamnose reductase [Clostridia bacterium]|nr:dTDP-4-dehydrorhamnose reductase [Clostridia bacterium]